jgi:hypothetical protein
MSRRNRLQGFRAPHLRPRGAAAAEQFVDAPLGAVRSPGRSGRHELDPSGQRAPTPPDRNPSSDPELLHALWLISHFGWIAEATIRRSLIISGAQEILATALAERLRQLLNRGWVEQRHTRRRNR